MSCTAVTPSFLRYAMPVGKSGCPSRDVPSSVNARYLPRCDSGKPPAGSLLKSPTWVSQTTVCASGTSGIWSRYQPSRIGAAEVHDHAAPAVHTGPARPRIGDAVHGTAIAFNQKVVIHAVLVVGEIVRPGTVGFRDASSTRPVRAVCRAPPSEPRANSLEASPGLRGRSPERELGAGSMQPAAPRVPLQAATDRRRSCSAVQS